MGAGQNASQLIQNGSALDTMINNVPQQTPSHYFISPVPSRRCGWPFSSTSWCSNDADDEVRAELVNWRAAAVGWIYILQCAWVDHKFNSVPLNWNEMKHCGRRGRDVVGPKETKQCSDYDPPTLLASTPYLIASNNKMASLFPLKLTQQHLHWCRWFMHSARINEF